MVLCKGKPFISLTLSSFFIIVCVMGGKEEKLTQSLLISSYMVCGVGLLCATRSRARLSPFPNPPTWPESPIPAHRSQR